MCHFYFARSSLFLVPSVQDTGLGIIGTLPKFALFLLMQDTVCKVLLIKQETVFLIMCSLGNLGEIGYLRGLPK